MLVIAAAWEMPNAWKSTSTPGSRAGANNNPALARSDYLNPVYSPPSRETPGVVAPG